MTSAELRATVDHGDTGIPRNHKNRLVWPRWIHLTSPLNGAFMYLMPVIWEGGAA